MPITLVPEYVADDNGIWVTITIRFNETCITLRNADFCNLEGLSTDLKQELEEDMQQAQAFSTALMNHQTACEDMGYFHLLCADLLNRSAHATRNYRLSQVQG
jgi:hypothetical protein